MPSLRDRNFARRAGHRYMIPPISGGQLGNVSWNELSCQEHPLLLRGRHSKFQTIVAIILSSPLHFAWLLTNFHRTLRNALLLMPRYYPLAISWLQSHMSHRAFDLSLLVLMPRRFECRPRESREPQLSLP
jgi:hypothetical protein